MTCESRLSGSIDAKAACGEDLTSGRGGLCAEYSFSAVTLSAACICRVRGVVLDF